MPGLQFALLCLALALGSAACGHPSAETGSTPGAPLTIGVIGASTNLRPLEQIFTSATLVGTAPDGRATPGLLETWTISPDKLTWEFTLRAGAIDDQGVPVTAATIVAAVEGEDEDEDEDEGQPLPGFLDVERLETVDARRLRIHLRAPSSLLLEALTLTRAEAAGAFTNEGPAGDAQNSPTLTGQPRHDGTPPTVTSITFKRFDSPRAAWAALMRDEIDVLHAVASDARSFLEQEPGIEVRSFLRPYLFTLGLNVRHPALRSRAARLALNHAVDRQEILASDLGGNGEIAAGPISPRHWAADPNVAPYAYDPALANRLLDEAGLPVRPGGERGPARVRLSCLLLAGDPRTERIALRLQRALEAVNVELVLEPVPGDVMMQRLEGGRFDTFLTTMISGYGINPVYQWWGAEYRGGMVAHGYRAAEEELTALRVAPDDVAFARELKRVQHVLYDDPPAVFLAWDETARAVGRRFIVPPSFERDIFSTLSQWRPRPAAEAAP